MDVRCKYNVNIYTVLKQTFGYLKTTSDILLQAMKYEAQSELVKESILAHYVELFDWFGKIKIKEMRDQHPPNRPANPRGYLK